MKEVLFKVFKVANVISNIVWGFIIIFILPIFLVPYGYGGFLMPQLYQMIPIIGPIILKILALYLASMLFLIF